MFIFLRTTNKLSLLLDYPYKKIMSKNTHKMGAAFIKCKVWGLYMGILFFIS